MPRPFYDRQTIIAALNRMAEIAEARGIQLQLAVYGGTAMMLVYDARDVTKDVDGVVLPASEGKRIAGEVAAELGLSEDWLNDDVSLFLSNENVTKTVEMELPEVSRAGLKILRPTAKYALALKVKACRKQMGAYKGDLEDIRILLKITKTQTIEQIEQVLNRYFPDSVVEPEKRIILGRILNENSNELTANSPPSPKTSEGSRIRFR